MGLAPLLATAGPMLANLLLALTSELDPYATNEQVQRTRARRIGDLHVQMLLPSTGHRVSGTGQPNPDNASRLSTNPVVWRSAVLT